MLKKRKRYLNRRSGDDRRGVYMLGFFLRGGQEKRSGEERRAYIERRKILGWKAEESDFYSHQ